jgi:hypothetical protein
METVLPQSEKHHLIKVDQKEEPDMMTARKEKMIRATLEIPEEVLENLLDEIHVQFGDKVKVVSIETRESKGVKPLSLRPPRT